MPPLPAIPGAPADNTAPAPVATPPAAENKQAAVADEARVKKHKKHHVLASASGSTGRRSLATRDYFRSERLPAAIYKKSYDKLNKHLPTAVYENQYDGLVFVTAQRDDLNGLRAMLDAGRNMELVDSEGDTPLLVAVKHNAINATRLLLGRHANYNVTDRNGQTPLQIAQEHGNFQIVHAIEAAGASVAQE